MVDGFEVVVLPAVAEGAVLAAVDFVVAFVVVLLPDLDPDFEVVAFALGASAGTSTGSASGPASSSRPLMTFSGRKFSFCWWRIQRRRSMSGP